MLVPQTYNSDLRPCKKIAILGSTGSIGTQTLDVSRELKLDVVALAAHKNLLKLADQIAEFQPALVSVATVELKSELINILKERKITPVPSIVCGVEGTVAVAEFSEADTCVAAIVGFAGLLPVIAAIKKGKRIALANKETLVVAGEYIRKLALQNQTVLLPLDSEHSAVWQCLLGKPEGSLQSVILTCSGGPFRDYTSAMLQQVTLQQALQHPTWKMGSKITIDSATLMNKGLEVIEACHLFGLKSKEVEVIIHKESIVHSLARFKDQSILAQFGRADMHMPIHVALAYPNIKMSNARAFDFTADHAETLSFLKPDPLTFPSLSLAREAFDQGGLMPCVLNAANEASVSLFLQEKITFCDIFNLLEKCMVQMSDMVQEHEPSYETMLNVHQEAFKRTLKNAAL